MKRHVLIYGLIGVGIEPGIMRVRWPGGMALAREGPDADIGRFER
jgi:hypothetical protein